MSYRDIKHWELTVGRVSLSRWCAGTPCSYNGWGGRHPVRLVIVRSGK